MSHLQQFGRAYIVGFLFVIVQVFTAIVGEFEGVKPEEMKTWSTFTWFIHWSEVIVSAGTVVLAFTNKTVSNADNKQPVSS